MKYYKAEFDANRKSSKRVTVPLNSRYGVAVKVRVNGEDLSFKDGELKIVDGARELSASGEIAGYTTFKLDSGSEAKQRELRVSACIDSNLNYENIQELTGNAPQSPQFQPSYNVDIGSLSVAGLKPEDVYINDDLKQDMPEHGTVPRWVRVVDILEGKAEPVGNVGAL